ncbi:MAG: hypothetical protein U0X41_05835 [Chitinophagales bacterium]
MKKIKIQLGRVQETLLLPLVSRAKETEYKNPLLNDTKAVNYLISWMLTETAAQYHRNWHYYVIL